MAPDGSQFSGRERLSPPVDVDPVRVQDDHASGLQRSRAAWDARAERWDARAEANALALVGSREHGIDVQVTLDPAANDVFVDRIQIQQVLFNIIRNAIEAMIDSPIRQLAISTRMGPGEFVTVGIEDTGAGIDETIAPQLFQPFITSKQKGMGIGLSICRTIIEAHGGRIWCEAGRETGTIFRFTLPRAGADDDEL